MVRLHRLENYKPVPTSHRYDNQHIVCSFETTNRGYFQLGYDKNGYQEISSEPSIHTLKIDERDEILKEIRAVWLLTATKEELKQSKDLIGKRSNGKV